MKSWKLVYGTIGSFSIDDGNGNENVVGKCEFAILLSLRDYSKHFKVAYYSFNGL